MNKDIIIGRWNEFTGEAKSLWGKLTDSDFNETKGNLESIKGRLQAVYGYTKQRAHDEVETLAKKFSSGVAQASEATKDAVRSK